MKRFDPKGFLPLPDRISVMPAHGGGWSGKLDNWWAGATIAAPAIEVVKAADASVETVRRLLRQGPKKLNQYYVEQTQQARRMVRLTLDLPESAPVLLDASGTAALLLATRILGHIADGAGSQTFFTITTDEGGSLVPATLRGLDPSEMEKTMFQPNTGLFYEPQPVLPYPPRTEILSQLVGLSKFDNDALVVELRRIAMEHLEAGHRFGCLVLPHVVKSGRILPLHAVSAMVQELRALGLNLYLVVDDVQGFGRVEGELCANPLQFCDAYVLGSAKALGGLLTASAVVIQAEAMQRFLHLAEQWRGLPFPCISHYQFPPEMEERLPEAMLKRGAVSLPEIVAMSAAIHHHYRRGVGDTYLARRHNQLELVASQRAQVVEALTAIPGIKVLESTPQRPLVPSIVSFETPKGVSPGALKDALQAGTPIVTPCAPIGRLLRLEIPEYRDMPSVEVLKERLLACLRELQTETAPVTTPEPVQPIQGPDLPEALPEPVEAGTSEPEVPVVQPQRPLLD